jgi:hypothetical protein
VSQESVVVKTLIVVLSMWGGVAAAEQTRAVTEIDSVEIDAITNPYTCPTGYPIDCDDGYCCDDAHPYCCSGGQCSTSSTCSTGGDGGGGGTTCPSGYPLSCGNGYCCDEAHPYCCSGGTCSSTSSCSGGGTTGGGGGGGETCPSGYTICGTSHCTPTSGVCCAPEGHEESYCQAGQTCTTDDHCLSNDGTTTTTSTGDDGGGGSPFANAKSLCAVNGDPATAAPIFAALGLLALRRRRR